MDKRRFLQSRAKAMRAAPQAAEERLWRLVRGRRAGGLKFRRQVPVGNYIADFACFDPRLIVEVDGTVHAHLREERDAVRDAWFAANHFRVLRFPEQQVWADPEAVVEAILREVGRELSTPHPAAPRPPSPARGEG